MNQHGGKRKGAGRPPLHVKKFYITLKSEQIEWLKAQGNASDQIRNLVEDKMRSKKMNEVFRNLTHQVTCGGGSETCAGSIEALQEETYTEAIDMFEQSGWHYVDGRGWMCPECYNELQLEN